MPEYSISQLDKFEECALQYKFINEVVSAFGNGNLNSQGHGKQFSHGRGKQKSQCMAWFCEENPLRGD